MIVIEDHGSKHTRKIYFQHTLVLLYCCNIESLVIVDSVCCVRVRVPAVDRYLVCVLFVLHDAYGERGACSSLRYPGK